MKKTLLSKLKLPYDLKKLSYRKCQLLCKEIRQLLIETVAENGGHLSSNLGSVELTVALHRVFNSPKDKLVWDVGHQAYTHKILTGRLDEFHTLRTNGGISGFVRPCESEHDIFISGHSSNSISAAYGIAKAMKLKGDEHYTVAIVGDGAFTGGMIYEGLNNAGKDNTNLIVILNDNGVSISKNVGAIAKYLSDLRGKEFYLNLKRNTENILNSIPIISAPLHKILSTSKDFLRYSIYRKNGSYTGTTMFENMGFVYLGPIDGHDIKSLEETLCAAKKAKKPVLIHVNTIKGKGYKPAENNPGKYHGVTAGSMKKSTAITNKEENFSAKMGSYLNEIAYKDNRICAITAAMKYGTGLNRFAENHPKRFFDVGIAEQHAVTFAAGLATNGMLPVFAVYSSFLQRGYDQVIHDAAICGTHIVLAIDRAGIVGEDGDTHQGIFDVPMLMTIPNVTIYSPSDYSELYNAMDKALYKTNGVAVVRYPKGSECSYHMASDDNGSYAYKNRGNKTLAIGYGRNGITLANATEKCDADILKVIKLYPIENDILDVCKKYSRLVIFEEGLIGGGFGERLIALLYNGGFEGKVKLYGIEDFVKHGKSDKLIEELGLDEATMINRIREFNEN